MIDGKLNFSGGLDLDSSDYLLPANAYVDALNITRRNVKGGNNHVISNIVGNQKVPFSYPSGVGKVIGKFPFLLRNSVIFFRWNQNNYHGVYEYDRTNNIINKIFENLTDSGGVDVLGFLKDVKITSVNVFGRDEGDLLFFIDCLGRPTQMDISLFKEGYYTPVTRDILDKCKKPPLLPPTVIYANDVTVSSNDLVKRLFRLKYRYIYDDFESSVFSPISRVPLPANVLDDTYTNVITNNNVIHVGLNSGDKNVKAIEVGVSFVDKTNDWSDFAQVEVIQKKSLILVNETNVYESIGNAHTSISGTVLSGVVINIYLTLLPNTKTLIGTYTTVLGDTSTSIATGLALSLNSMGIAIGVSSDGAYVIYSWPYATYQFNSIELLNNDKIDNADFSYSFYNDSTYPSIDINESIQLFDYVPDIAWAQELLNGNVLGYANITEGYDKDTSKSSIVTVGTVPATNSSGNGSLNAVLDYTSDTRFHQIAFYTFSGIPAIGTVINVKARLKSTNAIQIVSTYTTIYEDTLAFYSIAYKLVNSFCTQVPFKPNSVKVQVEKSTYIPIEGTLFVTIEIIPPSVSSAENSIATWKPSSSRKIARAYFDKHGKTNGILYTDSVVFPAYSENVGNVPMLPYINYKINDIPPEWAYSVGFYFNKVATTWIYWLTNSVIVPTEKYIYFEVTDFLMNAARFPTTSAVLSYSFKDGDRLRIIRNAYNNNVPGATYDTKILGLITDPKIDGAVTTPAGRQFIKIDKVAPFDSYVSQIYNYVIELYTPTQQTSNADNDVFFECARQYPILNPTLPNRAHVGEVTNQNPGITPAEYNFYEGDAYFHPRTIAISDLSVALFNVFDSNFVDTYISAVNSIDGRANIIDPNAKKETFPTLIRFSREYEANTNINGLSRFYGNNYDVYDYTFGAVTRLKIRDRYLKVFQMFKIGIVPLFGQITKDSSGKQSLIVTDKLLNPIQYRVGNMGLSAPESLASYHFADYGCDKNLGIVWRDSNDGVNAISTLFKVDSWAKAELPLRVGSSHIYGAFYPDTDLYIVALEASQPTCAEIMFVTGTTVATPITCASISDVIGYSQNSAVACASISSVSAFAENSGGAGITVVNQHTVADNYVYSLSPDSWVNIIGQFPVMAGGTATGSHVDFSGALSVSCSVTLDSRVEIYQNGTLLTCSGHIGTGSQIYNLSGLTILETDIIEIRLIPGGTCP